MQWGHSKHLPEAATKEMMLINQRTWHVPLEKHKWCPRRSGEGDAVSAWEDRKGTLDQVCLNSSVTVARNPFVVFPNPEYLLLSFLIFFLKTKGISLV